MQIIYRIYCTDENGEYLRDIIKMFCTEIQATFYVIFLLKPKTRIEVWRDSVCIAEVKYKKFE